MAASIVIPALNPEYALLSYVEKLLHSGFSHIIVVDDGSSPERAAIFHALEQDLHCTVLRHAVNMGKGRALKDAFNYYLTHLAEECTGVITADSDGQHTVEDVIRLEQAMGEHPHSLLLGARDFSQANVPFKSRNGNKITRAVIKLFYGGNIQDTQTGLRGIPNDLLPEYLTLQGERFEYETAMLIESLRKKIPVINVAIETVYLDNNSGTHFRPGADSWAIYKVILGTFLKYSLSSLSASAIDLLLFQLLLLLPTGLAGDMQIALATAGARVCSSLYNYLVNRNLVFSAKSRGRMTLIKYYALCMAQMLCSAGGVILLCKWIGLPELPVKLIVDSLLFLISFQIQKNWVFGSRDKTEQARGK